MWAGKGSLMVSQDRLSREVPFAHQDLLSRSVALEAGRGEAVGAGVSWTELRVCKRQTGECGHPNGFSLKC